MGTAYSFWQDVRNAQELPSFELTPEKEMLVAMIFRAAQDLHLTCRQTQLDAMVWLSQREFHCDNEGWSFCACCEYLGLSPSATRKAIYGMDPVKLGKGKAVRRVIPEDRRK